MSPPPIATRHAHHTYILYDWPRRRTSAAAPKQSSYFGGGGGVYRVFGRFVKRGVKKHTTKNTSGHTKKNVGFFPSVFFPPSVVLLDLFGRVFGRFATRGVQKRDKKLKDFFAAAKKSTYLRHLFFFTAPLGRGHSCIVDSTSHSTVFAKRFL
jgi:hypothetical protein